jgi:hypothetical protein
MGGVPERVALQAPDEGLRRAMLRPRDRPLSALWARQIEDSATRGYLACRAATATRSRLDAISCTAPRHAAHTCEFCETCLLTNLERRHALASCRRHRPRELNSGLWYRKGRIQTP